MVHEYAMGTGLTSQRVTVEGDELSDMTRRMRDQEQRDLADEAYRGAYDIVQRHRDKLDELARTLLANEVLEREDIDRIMAGVPRIRHEPGVQVGLAATADPEASERSD